MVWESGLAAPGKVAFALAGVASAKPATLLAPSAASAPAACLFFTFFTRPRLPFWERVQPSRSHSPET